MSAARFDILQLAETGRVEDVLRDIRVRALWSPWYFAKTVLGYTKLTEGFHLPESNMFVARWEAGYTRQVVEWPRAFYKSTLKTISTSMWGALPHNDDDARYAIDRLGISEDAWRRRMTLHNQDVTQLIGFESATNAVKKIREIRWHYESNNMFRSIFPEIACNGKEPVWTNENLIHRRVGYAQRAAEGTYEGLGVGGVLQSRHYDRHWFDDLVGKAARDSMDIMQKTIDWVNLTFGAFTSAARENQTRFVIGNRWALQDLNAWLRENAADTVFYTSRAISYTEDGTEVATCPEILTLADIAAIRREMGEADFSCQYLNEPVVESQMDGAARAMHTFTADREGKLTCSCGYTNSIENTRRYIHYDPYTAKKTSVSRPGIVVCAVAPNGHVFILETFSLRTDYSGIYDKIFALAAKYSVHMFTYEDVGAQNMTEFYIRQRSRSTNTPFPPISAIKTGNKGMELRIRDYLLPAIRSGRVSVRDIDVTVRQMLATFPATSFDHDYDILDALAQGATVWRAPRDIEEFRQEKSTLSELLSDIEAPYSHLVTQ